MTDTFPGLPARGAAGAEPPEDVRVRRQASGGDHYLVVEVEHGTRLDHLASRLVMLDPSAVLMSVTGGAGGELLFRVDDPDRAETRGSFNGFVSGGMANVPYNSRRGY